MKLSPQFVVNERGEQTGVLLPIEEYRKVLDVLEDRLDAIDLDEAMREERELVPYDEVKAELQREG